MFTSKFHSRTLLLLLVFMCLLGLGGVNLSLAQERTLVHSFANKTSISPFYFINGAEFPGATGSMNIISDGFMGNSARITYNLTSGAYVAAIYDFPRPLTFTKMTFALRYACTQNTKLSLRLTDSSGQTFQMSGLQQPFDSLMTGWSEIYLQPTNATEHWGGANDGIFHPPFKQFSIVLGLVEKITAAAGCIDLDNFQVMNETQPIILNLTDNVVTVPWPGDMASKMGVCVHSANIAELNAARDAGFSMIRIDLFWSWVENNRGVYVWSTFDSIVSNLKARNMTALFILTYNNDLYKAPDGGFNATTIEAFGNYSRAAAKHFAGTGTKFEVYNEANGNGFTGTTYAPLAIAAIKGVHEGDPNAKVSTTGISGFDFTFLINSLIGGAGKEADAIGLHPYGVGYKSGVGSMVDSARLFKNYVNMYLKTRSSVPPVWDTEMGLSSTDYDPSGGTNGLDSTALRIQANRATERLLASLAVGFEMFQYYDLRNDGTDPANREHNFGLLFNNYTEKPAFRAVKQLSMMVQGKTFDAFYKISPSPLTAMRFTNENETLVIVFAQVLNVQAKLTLVQTPKSIVDIFNNPLTATQNSLTITDTGGLVYLVYDNVKVVPKSSSVTPKASGSNRSVRNSTIAQRVHPHSNGQVLC